MERRPAGRAATRAALRTNGRPSGTSSRLGGDGSCDQSRRHNGCGTGRRHLQCANRTVGEGVALEEIVPAVIARTSGVRDRPLSPEPGASEPLRCQPSAVIRDADGDGCTGTCANNDGEPDVLGGAAHTSTTCCGRAKLREHLPTGAWIIAWRTGSASAINTAIHCQMSRFAKTGIIKALHSFHIWAGHPLTPTFRSPTHHPFITSHRSIISRRLTSQFGTLPVVSPLSFPPVLFARGQID